jgi:hypothetical protein
MTVEITSNFTASPDPIGPVKTLESDWEDLPGFQPGFHQPGVDGSQQGLSFDMKTLPSVRKSVINAAHTPAGIKRHL